MTPPPLAGTARRSRQMTAIGTSFVTKAVAGGCTVAPMTARRNLSGAEFGPLFHGTNADLKPGDVISPSRTLGTDPMTEGLSESDPHRSVAHASESALMAASYADRAVAQAGGRFNLYRVAPVDREDVRHEMEDEHSSPSGFKVVRRLPVERSDDPRLATQHEHLMKFYDRRYS